jgi:hypothetical protein
MRLIGLASGILDVNKILVNAIGVLDAVMSLPLIEARGGMLDCPCN